jgi:hypothetical protein
MLEAPSFLSLESARGLTLVKFPFDTVHLGPNEVHAVITHQDCAHGQGHRPAFEDLGISYNLITNAGKDYVAKTLGGKLGFGVTGTIATASSATSLTATATPFVASAYIGQIVVAEQGTSAPVWGNIGANSTSVLTVDAWYQGDDSAGTTPGSTANYNILAGGGMARYMALTENASAASTASTALTGEISTGGCSRALATFAHTDGTSTYTLVKAFSVTASFPAIHRMGLFTAGTLAAAGVICFETVLNADANVVNGDTLTITETVTLS